MNRFAITLCLGAIALVIPMLPGAQAQFALDISAVAVKGTLAPPDPSDTLVTDPLVASLLPYRPQPAVGGEAYLTARISNAGTLPVNSLRIGFSENGMAAGSAVTSYLLPGETRNVTIPWTPRFSRDVTLRAVADPAEEMLESDETNNAISAIQRIHHGRLTGEQQQVLDQIAKGLPVGPWPGLSEGQVYHIEAKAEEYLDEYHQHHMPFGTTADLWLYTRDPDSGVYRYEGIGDSATWAGHHLAALALKYASTGAPDTLAAIHHVVDAIDRLTRVSGRHGYIARFAGPRDDPAYKGYYEVYGGGADPNRPGFGMKAFSGVPPYDDLVWLGNSSRDTYDGTVLGLAAAYRLVEDTAVRAKIQTIAEAVLDRLEADNWTILDGQGSSTSSEASMTAAWLLTGAVINPGKYRDAYEGAAPAVGEPRGKGMNAPEYFSNNLNYILHHVLCTMEYDPVRSASWRRGMMTLWNDTRNHHNAWFAALYMDATGDTGNAFARPTLEALLYGFPEFARWGETRNHLGRTDILYEIGGQTGQPFVQVFAKYPLPIEERVPSDFIWQRQPGATLTIQTAALRYPGIDLFAPYFMDVFMKNNPAPMSPAAVNVTGVSLIPDLGNPLNLTDPFAANQFIPLPEWPEAGITIMLDLQVGNRGADPLEKLPVDVYEGNPAEGGKILGRHEADVPPHSTVHLEQSWSPSSPGSYEIYVQVDPEAIFGDVSRADNLFWRPITVLAPGLPVHDLALEAFRVDPGATVDIGSEAALTASVANRGPLGETDVTVRFYDGDPAYGGIPIADAAIDSLASGEVRDVTVRWAVNEPAGPRTLYVQADPDDALAELDEDNNSGSAEVQVVRRAFVDDCDSSVNYAFGWHMESGPGAIQGTYHMRKGSPQGVIPAATLRFSGHEITVYYGKSARGGLARVVIDGVEAGAIDHALQGSGSDNPVFGYSVTFGNLGDGGHEIRVEHTEGASYLDGFEIRFGGDGGGPVPAASSYTQEYWQETFPLGGMPHPVAGVPLMAGEGDTALSILVEGPDHPVSVQLFDPLGIVIAQADALLPGDSDSGLDAVLGLPGEYTAIVADPLGPTVPAIMRTAMTRRHCK